MLQIVARYRDRMLSFPAPAKEVRLGSSAGCGISLPYPGVSRRHAWVRPVEGGISITDAGSKNGLALLGRRVPEALLKPGESVRLGPVLLSLEEISTDEVALGLALPDVAAEERPSSETSSTPPSEGEPAGALRFVREVEQERIDTCRPAFLRRACDALGAVSLVVFGRTPSGIALRRVGGALPSEEACDELGRAGAASSRPRLVAGLPALIAPSADSDSAEAIAAFFEGEVPAWKRDLFAYVARKAVGEPVQEHAAAPVANDGEGDDSLHVPAGMVVGRSAAFGALLAQIRATVKSALDVLISGETGTGKELIARMIHASGPNPAGPFIAINCAAIPNELLEAELFGVHTRAATGVDPRPGRFMQADGGVIVLDEVGELAPPLQAKLLRVLQEREVLPIGAPRPQRVSLRVVSISNRDLGEMSRAGDFRSDLYYRLRGLQFHVPPLRERREDIPDLVLEFVTAAAERSGRCVRGMSRKALALLMTHDWPGNVRELKNEVQRAVLVCPSGGSLRVEHFGPLGWAAENRETRTEAPAPCVQQGSSVDLLTGAPAPLARGSLDLEERCAAVERETIQLALKRAKGNRSLAARLLALSRNGLAARMRALKIEGKG